MRPTFLKPAVASALSAFPVVDNRVCRRSSLLRSRTTGSLAGRGILRHTRH
jgi:hypothetical protein